MILGFQCRGPGSVPGLGVKSHIPLSQLKSCMTWGSQKKKKVALGFFGEKYTTQVRESKNELRGQMQAASQDSSS